jgi:MarR family transcriptional regulator for hemolysin
MCWRRTSPSRKCHVTFISLLIISGAHGGAPPCPAVPWIWNFLFTLGELQRLVRAYADKQAARYGITRAQWAVLAKVERTEGLKQSELAEQMEMQPITLTRLIDRLCDNGWIERRDDETDRRVNRLYLRKAARPLLGKLSGLRSELTATALEGINPTEAHRLLAQLEAIKENVRNAIQNPSDEPRKNEQRYG